MERIPASEADTREADMRRRSLPDPLLAVSDGAPGIIRAIEECLLRALRQRCLAHKMRNLASKLPEDLWPDFKARAAACYQEIQCVSNEIAHHGEWDVSDPQAPRSMGIKGHDATYAGLMARSFSAVSPSIATRSASLNPGVSRMWSTAVLVHGKG
jgi:hypothetical protein